MIEVYYPNQGTLTLDKNIFSLGTYGITLNGKIHYYKGWTLIVDGEEKYFTKFHNSE